MNFSISFTNITAR